MEAEQFDLIEELVRIKQQLDTQQYYISKIRFELEVVLKHLGYDCDIDCKESNNTETA